MVFIPVVRRVGRAGDGGGVDLLWNVHGALIVIVCFGMFFILDSRGKTAPVCSRECSRVHLRHRGRNAWRRG